MSTSWLFSMIDWLFDRIIFPRVRSALTEAGEDYLADFDLVLWDFEADTEEARRLEGLRALRERLLRDSEQP